MVGDPLSRVAADAAAAGRDLEDLEEPTRTYTTQLAEAFREEAPVASGTLRGSVFTDAEGVGVGAPYAGYVTNWNPYDDRALARTDPGEVYGQYADEVLDHHFHTLYI